ncbi:MAG: hypothetical protein ABIB79_03205 [archaeon]
MKKKELTREEEQRLSYQIVAEFMNTYEEVIKPNLQAGKLEDIKFLLMDVFVRAEYVIKQKLPPMKERGAYTNYRMAIHELGGLAQYKLMTDRLFTTAFHSIERSVIRLHDVLKDNPIYQEFREASTQ